MDRSTSRSLDRTIERWLASLASPNTRDAYRRDLEVYRTWLRANAIAFADVDGADIEAFRADCESNGASGATVNRRVSAIGSFHRFATARTGDPDPTAGVARRPTADNSATALSNAQAARVWASAEQLGPRTAAIVGLVMLNGWKGHELLALDASSVHIDRSSVRIDGGVPLDPRTSGAIRAHLGTRTAGPFLYGENPTRERARLTRYGIDYLVKQVGTQASLARPLTVNVLRATHQSQGFVQNGR